ncbi:organic cation transporter protein-like [Anticarsia gemmatalis]|uniref:organic cation transporter protein-like n=1 Tax=Anticarsia gemmatalis TaxID=129554 RepID=UPI003F7581F9
MVCEEKQKTHLDDVLGKFGMFGAYHRQLILLIGLAYASNTAYSSNYVFAVEEVDYRCADAAFENNTCGTINSARCTEWIYDKPDSFVAEFGLACQDWKRTLVGTVHSLAYMVGLIFVGPLSDRLGRKAMIILTGVIGGVLGVARSFVTSYWLYIALEFLESAFGDICSPAYILNVEIVSTKKRVPFFTITSIGYSVGAVIKAFIAWIVPDWRNFLRVLYAPALLFFFYLFCLDESPRWLLIKGRKKEAVQIIQKMSKKNKVKIDENVLDNLICDTDKEENVEFSAVFKSMFSSFALVQRFIICVVWWTTSTFVNYGMTITSVSLQGNKYINYSLIALIEVPGGFLAMYILMKYRRKFPLIWSFLLAGLFCVGQPFLPTDMPWLSITMFMAGKFMASLYFTITYIFTSELFPTYTRNSMHALCSSLGRVGSIVAPQAPLLTVYWEGLPSLIFGIVSIIAGLITFLVPDVAEISLPDTVKEAEAIGMKEKKDIVLNHNNVISIEHCDDKEGMKNRGFEWKE